MRTPLLWKVRDLGEGSGEERYVVVKWEKKR